MNLSIFYAKSSEWEKYLDVFKEVVRTRARPRKMFILEINTDEDIKKAIKAGVPIFKIDSRDLAILRYPMNVPPTIVVPREYEGVIRTKYRIHTFQSLAPFTERRIEDIVIFVLSFDLIATRAIIQRNRDLIDFQYLQKRILQEELEERATKIHLQEFVHVPKVGDSLPRAALLRAAEGNFARGLIP